VALAVWLASDLTSDAPRKASAASPARAASMVAFSASRLSGAAWNGSGPIHFADPAGGFRQSLDGAVVSCALLTARLAMPAAWRACR